MFVFSLATKVNQDGHLFTDAYNWLLLFIFIAKSVKIFRKKIEVTVLTQMFWQFINTMFMFVCYVFDADQLLFNLSFSLGGTPAPLKTNKTHFSTSSTVKEFLLHACLYTPQINKIFFQGSKSLVNLYHCMDSTITYCRCSHR